MEKTVRTCDKCDALIQDVETYFEFVLRRSQNGTSNFTIQVCTGCGTTASLSSIIKAFWEKYPPKVRDMST